MRNKLLKILILSFFSVVFISCNPDTCYLDDCTNIDKMKISLLDNFGHHILEPYRDIVSLEWIFIETDSTYDVEFFEKEKIAKRNNIIQEPFHIIVIKKDCKATFYLYKTRFKDGEFENY